MKDRFALINLEKQYPVTVTSLDNLVTMNQSLDTLADNIKQCHSEMERIVIKSWHNH